MEWLKRAQVEEEVKITQFMPKLIIVHYLTEAGKTYSMGIGISLIGGMKCD